jgi:hypothetical protein
MSSHCFFDRLVAMRGYSMDFMMQNWSEYHASAGENLPVRTRSAHRLASLSSAWVWARWEWRGWVALLGLIVGEPAAWLIRRRPAG